MQKKPFQGEIMGQAFERNVYNGYELIKVDLNDKNDQLLFEATKKIFKEDDLNELLSIGSVYRVGLEFNINVDKTNKIDFEDKEQAKILFGKVLYIIINYNQLSGNDFLKNYNLKKIFTEYKKISKFHSSSEDELTYFLNEEDKQREVA